MTAAPQKLKLLDTALYSVATGVGMRWIAVAAAVGPSSLPLWILALFVFFIPLSVATLELTARFEGEGGIYAWVRDTLGPLGGFLCGWFYYVGLMPYFASILYFLSGLAISAIGGDPGDRLLYMSISTGLTVLVTALQLAGLKWGKWPPNFGVAGAWIVLFVIVAVAAIIGGRGESATDFLHSSYLPPWNFGTAILWGTIFFAYSGAEAVAFLRNDIEGGMRTILRALVALGVGSVIIYMVGTTAFLIILPQDALTRLTGFPDALRMGLEHVKLGALAPAVIGLFALAMMGSFAGWFGVAARLPFAAGIDAYLPKVFAWRHPKTGAPVPALLLQAVLTLAMVGPQPGRHQRGGRLRLPGGDERARRDAALCLHVRGLSEGLAPAAHPRRLAASGRRAHLHRARLDRACLHHRRHRLHSGAELGGRRSVGGRDEDRVRNLGDDGRRICYLQLKRRSST